MEELRIRADCGAEALIESLPDWRLVEQARELSVCVEKGAGPDSPLAYAALAAYVDARAREGHVTSLQFEEDQAGVAWRVAYGDSPSNRIGFYSCDGVPPFSGGRVRDLPTARRMAEEATDILATNAPGLSPSIVRMTRFVLEELGANVVDHSARADTGWGVLRVDATVPRLAFAFADRGVGFRASLQRHPLLEESVSDDTEALQIALSQNLGRNLPSLLWFSDVLGADVWIASGTAALHRRTVTSEVRTNVLRQTAGWQGTLISFDAPLG